MADPGTSPPIITSDAELSPDDGGRRGRPEKGIALCLSGGGYRAMLFHLGVLHYLNDIGWLPKLDRISSVSGGSITAAMLALGWSRLEFDEGSRAANFESEVAAPLHHLAQVTIDRRAILGGVLTTGRPAQMLINAYRREIFGDATLQAFPDRPDFVINATNVQSGALFRFSKAFIRDYRVGRISRPTTLVAEAVGASSAFPPLLSPVVLHFRPENFDEGTGEDLERAPYNEKVYLTDGGVYDNLGIETAWKRYRTILVSDAGSRLEPEPRPHSDWMRHGVRVLGIVDNQVRSLRKRQLIASFRSGLRDGAYWGIRSDIRHYRAKGTLPCPHDRTMKLARTPTRLDRLSGGLGKRLVNWGYAICDAAMRRHVDTDLPAPRSFPHPRVGV